MDNKELIRKLLEAAWNQGDTKTVEGLIAPNAQIHDPTIPNAQPGPQALLDQMRLYRGAFQDLRFTVDHQIAEGDYVVSRWTARGTHTGPLMGAAPTQRKSTVTGIQIDRCQNGKVVESWVNWDTIGLMTQIGVAPPITSSAGAGATRGAVHK